MSKIAFPFKLETKRLVIASPKASDAQAFFEAVIDSYDILKPWMPWVDAVTTIGQAKDSCLKAEKAFMEGTDYRLHIFLKDTGTFIGGSGLHSVDWSIPKMEIGYWGRLSHRNNGYITEAVDAISRYALQSLQANRVEIMASSVNKPSLRIPERLGYTLEGILKNVSRHADGSLRDTCIYAVTSTAQLKFTADVTRRPSGSGQRS